MRTAEEMYAYAKENQYGRGMSEKWAKKHFGIIERNLGPNEEVLMTFIGLKDYISPSNHKNNYAYAITNKRMMFAQKKLLKEDFKSVMIDKINDIGATSGLLLGAITIDTLSEIFNVGVDKATAERISQELHRIIFNL